jgi:hypothetical protein
MQSICYIVPYFGKLPKNFQLWLNSCSTNKTVNWMIFTNDKSDYNYPQNVKVNYCEFEEIKMKIINNFDFEVKIDSYWNLSLFKPAYGEIFKEYIKEYDFWGHCDVDVLWGDIRKFLNEDVLKKFDKIGYQGHSTLYRNNKEVNSRYKTIVPNEINYIDVFSGKIKYSFDENGMEKIYNFLNIEYYKEPIFAHLRKFEYNFSLAHMPIEEEYKNKHQIFIWDSGKLYRKYLYNKKIYTEEFMYIHFFCRPMSYKAKNFNENAKYIIFPDQLVDFNNIQLTYNYIYRKSKKSRIKFLVKTFYLNRKKITIKKLVFNFKRLIINKLKNRRNK